ncbi:insulinase family protein [Neptunomonas japonica]|uniref:Peptidase M16 n=1 Tax=Neptunomonas japonica JAMM 1380 TaxID=1441457 RepID=A0A7R6PHK6_9GAMM|nr:insulinase family protein [Neptunomonas japonica]BBB29753.1 peptidase M16 [Neptunomonas japonica JAMM 1380]
MPAENAHTSFEFIRSEKIESLNVHVEEYRHKVTGAMHFHIAADQDENVFLVAFRTVPMDSKGVAHILEHTALCGSEHYPVRDPFFMMTRRSLNTFMNAFTSSDWTAYPFASQNRKDFFNLLDVYLDATFYSRLDPLDFAQEGHRVEFEEPNNPESPLVYKGVVLNEMKGAMSSPVSTLWQTATKYLFPTVTYHFNSGGDPDSITDLSYDELLAFYRTHYHPSNAVFMTFGNIPAKELQTRFDEQALSNFEKLDINIEVSDEKHIFSPVKVEEAYALDEDDVSGKTHHVMSWLLGQSIDLKEQLKAHLLSRVLLDNSASPLRYALESSELGSAPSPLCGLEDSNRQMSFMCGLEGSEPESAAAFEQLILETLQRVAKDGVPQSMVEAQLHQLELGQREISGDGYPYGLSLIMASVSSAIHRGDPIALLNLDPVLDELRELIKDPDFIPSMIRELLLDNTHRVRLTLRPDNKMTERKDIDEKAKLAVIKSGLSQEQTQFVIDQAAALEARQMQLDDESILPKVTLQDVPTQMHVPISEQETLAGQTFDWYGQGTNGLVYQQVIIDLPELSDDELQIMPLFSHCMTELGCADRSYQENQQYHVQISGGVSAYTTMRGATDDEQSVSGYFVVSGKALLHNQEALTNLLHETLNEARFDETTRLREIVSQQRSRKEQSITGQGHSLAIMAAAAQLSPVARVDQKSRGLESIRFVKALDKQLDDPAALQALSAKLVAMHEKIKQAPRRFLLIGEPEQKESLAASMNQQWGASKGATTSSLALKPTREVVKQLWTTSTQVSFCAKAYPTVPVDHEDSAALTILGDFLRNGFLHRAIREQGGAYGSGAGQDSGEAVFRFFSYRDPRLTETLDDFDESVSWLLDNDHDEAKLEEAILGVVSSIDKPGSPAGEAKGAYHSSLFGRTPEHRKAFRQRILNVKTDDLKRVAAKYLKSELASIAAVTSVEKAKGLEDQFEVIAL